jgi:hypothetical protein
MLEVFYMLDQSTFWLDQYGQKRYIAELEDGHKVHILAWLERHAAVFHEMEILWYIALSDHPFLGPRGEMAQEAFELEFEGRVEESPLEWIQMTPCYKAIREALKCPLSPIL